MNIGLIGNPNVGKSTIFNSLTGMRQHTGNWPGKTVCSASGKFHYKDKIYNLIDLPGTYSLTAKSKEEEVTRDFVYFNNYDLLIVVCDAVCLERNLNLLLQILEVTSKVILCVNMMDEAEKKKIDIDINGLKEILKIPVIKTSYKDKSSIKKIKEEIYNFKEKEVYCLEYDKIIVTASNIIKKQLPNLNDKICHDLLCEDKNLIEKLTETYNYNDLMNSISKAQDYLYNYGIQKTDIFNILTMKMTESSNEIANSIITFNKEDYDKRDRVLDKMLTGKMTSVPIMILFLLLILWITIFGANIPSKILYNFFYGLEDYLLTFLKLIHLPDIFISAFVYGIYRVSLWVISVMLPPMAIFFTLFALLEDFGILPRIAFNLDRYFKKCASCGKQALTMCMGFGCNATAIIGTRIIDSKRERIIAILTNSFVPCNGRFTALIAIITMFFVCTSFFSSLFLTLLIVFSILITFFVSKILSKTILKGQSSSFVLELPPYRKPQILKTIIRAFLDKTLFVLLRAIKVAAPAGLIIWIFANVNIDGISILKYCSNFLDPFAHLIGLDGTILLSFILGLPANEIVIPIMLMGYMSLGNIMDISNIVNLKTILVDNGWTIVTALCFMIFSLMHFPCLTTILTIKKEAGIKWSIYSIIIPLVTGICVCFIVNSILSLFI